jgi:hypothetical protein
MPPSLGPLKDEYAPDWGPFHSRYQTVIAEHDDACRQVLKFGVPWTTAATEAVARAAIVMWPRDVSGLMCDGVGVTLALLAAHPGGDHSRQRERDQAMRLPTTCRTGWLGPAGAGVENAALGYVSPNPAAGHRACHEVCAATRNLPSILSRPAP